MNQKRSKSIRQLFLERTEIEAALKRAVREAVRLHKQAGLPMVVWKDGKVEWVAADAFELDGGEETPQQ
jgi:methionine synthase II (cobalamin-independent)